MTPKEQAIKQAYGDKYDTLKDQIDENGWVEHCPGEEGHPNWRDLVKYEYELECIEGFPDQWRPKSLRGLETNQGWISVREGVPHDQQHCWFWIKEQGAIIGFWDEEGEAFFVTGVIMVPDAYGITHWQPVTKPEAPLY